MRVVLEDPEVRRQRDREEPNFPRHPTGFSYPTESERPFGEVWVLEEEPDERANQPTRRRRQRSGREERKVELPPEVEAELADAVGAQRGRKLAGLLADAAHAYKRDRYEDALRLVRKVVEEVPESAAAQELAGLACYRLGRWREAIARLEAIREAPGSGVDQLPVLMDCRRALGQFRKVEALWKELRQASPEPEVLAEGRLVMACALADRGNEGDLGAGISLLEEAGADRDRRNPAPRHLRQWYALADLCERAGDLPRARRLFARVEAHDPDLADVRRRLDSLGRPSPRHTSHARSVVTLGELARRD